MPIEQKTKKEGQKPDYVSDGIAVWVNSNEKGEYLAIKLTGHNTIYAKKLSK